MDIIPAILPKNYEDLKNKIALVRGIVPVAQIDICDGIFVKNISWPFEVGVPELDEHFRRIINEQEGLPFWEDIDFELDLMVSDAVENFDIYTKLGPKRIIFHLEAVGNVEEFKNFMEGIDMYVRDSIQIGLAVNADTEISKIFPLVNSVDFVQCMGISEIGFQGQEFDERVLENIKKLKEKFSILIISVDGGVNLENAESLVSAGANRLVIGSALFNTDDIIGAVESFKNIN
ncbi:MAG: hypothetical protein AAB687_00320 [Patescibacteria group bacterium]